ncbi:MAG: N-acetylmuramoyl-L-alanine amidase [Calditrichia bacterium]
MDRRYFIKSIPLFGYLLLKVQSSFGSAIRRLIFPHAASGDISVSSGGGPAVKVPIWHVNNLAYISSLRLAKSLGYHTYLNEAKRKIVLYFPDYKIVVTANNAFIIINEETYQMAAPALWDKGEIYVPVRYFVPLVNRYTTLRLDFDAREEVLQVNKTGANLTQIRIEEKDNGTLIRIHTPHDFKKGEVTADMRAGWLHVDFYGGKVDEVTFKKTQPRGLVRKVKSFQYEQLASLAFLLKDTPHSTELVLNHSKNEVLVVLRTRDNLTEDELAELREEENSSKPSEDVRRQLEEERRKWLIDVVVIDAGHGGKDPGAIGYGKTREKDVVLGIAKKLGEMINKELPGVKVIYTRSGDQFIPLRRRTQIANENNGKVFISIHANSNRKKSVSGFETYILGPQKGEMAKSVVLKENAVINFEDSSSRQGYSGINQILATMAQNAFSRQSEYLAALVQQELDRNLRSLKIPNRGVKQGPFWVMVGASMPNILVETGFVSNSYDSKILKTASHQYKIAEGIFKGLKRFKQDYENAI